ncbi:MAG: hypothetical protein H7641_04210, partial [Candidatus Heimdallarchaeota archaeon]|nr:hypothetical protein [Candidatus Heimdallarchaeota archaeon]MCK4876767.1 hypothetical protein [Candidatus Heimdallarchaeota archaeon]
MKKIAIIVLIFLPIISGMNIQENQISVVAYSTSIDVSGAVFLIDISHDPFHTSFERLYSNLTSRGNAVIINKGNLSLSDNVDVLFLPDSYTFFTTSEKELIDNWINQGDKLIVISGDSDYGGYYDPVINNEVLEYIGSQIRLDSTMISDSVFSDGASYRVAATEYGTTPTASILSSGCDAGIMMHSPCAVLGYDGVNHIDLRDTTLPNVEVLISYSANATSGDSDNSSIPTDLYANDPDNGDYPAVVYEKIATTSGDNSHIIVCGEAIYSDYKDMYDQKTETGVYNGGTQYGQKFVNNIINYFVESKINPENVITILSDADFINYGFLGSGTAEDP